MRWCAQSFPSKSQSLLRGLLAVFFHDSGERLAVDGGPEQPAVETGGESIAIRKTDVGAGEGEEFQFVGTEDLTEPGSDLIEVSSLHDTLAVT